MAAAPPRRLQVFNPNELAEINEAEEVGEQPPAAPQTEPTSEETPPAVEPEPVSPTPPPVETAPRTVPLSRFQEVINERNQLREQWARLDERRRQAAEIEEAQRRAAAQAQQPVRPDPAMDPVGAELFDLRRAYGELATRFNEQGQALGQIQQGYQQNYQDAELNNWISHQVQQYAANEPTYMPVVNGFGNWRQEFWNEMSGGSAEFARTLIGGETKMVMQVSKAAGVNPGPILHKYGRVIEAGLKALAAEARNGAAPAPTRAAASNAGRVLAQVAKGQGVQGLSRIPAAGGEARSRYRDMTNAELAVLPEGEFQAALANPQTRADILYAFRKAEGLSEDDNVDFGLRR